MVDDEGQDNAGSQKKLYPEGVVVAVVGWLELHEDQVAGSWVGTRLLGCHGYLVVMVTWLSWLLG